MVAARSLASARTAVGRIGDGQPTDRPEDCFSAGAITLIGLPEAAIAEQATRLASRLAPCPGAVALHLAGALDAEVLAPLRRCGIAVGSCHPLAVFASRDAAAAPLTGITFDLDGDATARAAARELVAAVGGSAIELAGDGKALFHAAACTAANALTAVFDVAEQLAQAGGAPAAAARPALIALAQSALATIAAHGAPAALTGPIERGEVDVVAAHLAALARTAPHLVPAYRQCAQATFATAQRRPGRDPARDAAIARLLAE